MFIHTAISYDAGKVRYRHVLKPADYVTLSDSGK